MESIEILKIAALANLFVFLIVYGTGAFRGIDPKKKSSWLYGLYGFLSFFFVVFFFTDPADLSGGLLVGTIMAFMVMFTGAMIYWQRQYYKEAGASWLSRYGQEEKLSLLARILKNLQHK